MKIKIKVKLLNDNCKPIINRLGDWIDLRSAATIELEPNEVHYIPLGIAMQLPKGYEAVVNSRSSGPKKLGLIIPNGQGIIDNSYNGDSDEWHYIAYPYRDNVTIQEGDRICQFRIQLSQKATIWQKIRWLFSSGIKLEFVKHLSNSNRGGFGSTGIQ